MGISLKMKSKSDVKSTNQPESNEPEGYEGPETHVSSGKLKLAKKTPAVAAPAKKAEKVKVEKVAVEKDFNAPAKSGVGLARQLLLQSVEFPATDDEMIAKVQLTFPKFNGKFLAIQRSEINNHRACKEQVEAKEIALPIPRYIKDANGECIVAAGKQRSIKAPKEESKAVISKIAASLPKKAAVDSAPAKKAPAKKVVAPAKKVPSKKK